MFIRANGPRSPNALYWKPFRKQPTCDELEADTEDITRKGWQRTVGRSAALTEWAYDIHEADRESYVRPIHRETAKRLRKPSDDELD